MTHRRVRAKVNYEEVGKNCQPKESECGCNGTFHCKKCGCDVDCTCTKQPNRESVKPDEEMAIDNKRQKAYYVARSIVQSNWFQKPVEGEGKVIDAIVDSIIEIVMQYDRNLTQISQTSFQQGKESGFSEGDVAELREIIKRSVPVISGRQMESRDRGARQQREISLQAFDTTLNSIKARKQSDDQPKS